MLHDLLYSTLVKSSFTVKYYGGSGWQLIDAHQTSRIYAKRAVDELNKLQHLEKHECILGDSTYPFIHYSFDHEDASYHVVGLIIDTSPSYKANHLSCLVISSANALEVRHMVNLITDQHPEEKVYNYQLLTPREQTVVKLIKKGYTQKQMASTMQISVSTVETYKDKIFKKYGVRSSVELITMMLSN